MTPWTVACQLPCPYGFPGRNAGVGCHFLLQGIFPTQASNPGLPHCRQTPYTLSHQGNPTTKIWKTVADWEIRLCVLTSSSTLTLFFFSVVAVCSFFLEKRLPLDSISWNWHTRCLGIMDCTCHSESTWSWPWRSMSKPFRDMLGVHSAKQICVCLLWLVQS